MRAQMEIMGLVFVVVFLIFGLLLYISFSSGNESLPSAKITQASFYGTQLETAILETDIPECNMNFGVLMSRCVVFSSCGGRSACAVAYDAWDTMLSNTLGDETTPTAVNYRAYIAQNGVPLRIEGEEFLKEPFPECTENSNTYAGPRQPIATTAGVLEFVVEFCS